MGLILPSVQTQQPQINRGLSALARSLGFTHAWNWGGGGVAPCDAVSNSQTFSLVNNATAVTGLGGRAVRFNGTSSDRLEIAGNPFATSTCTYLWIESGVDATGVGQSLTESKYSSITTGENSSLQIRPTGSNIQIVQAQVAVTLTGTGARDNTGNVNVSALSVAGNNGRHALFTGGKLIASASPASSYSHGTSAVGGGSDCPSSTIKTYVLFFAPSVIPDSVLQDLTRNPWKLFQASQRQMPVDAPVAGSPTGTFATTMGDATLAASGAVVDVSTFAATMANATMAASGAVTDAGTFSSLLDNATMSAAGGIVSTGSFASTLAGASMAASGSSGSFVPYTNPIITRRHLRSRSRSNFGA